MGNDNKKVKTKKVDPISLTDRDRAIILDCFRHKGISGKGIAKKYFPSVKRSNERLNALVGNKYLNSMLYAEDIKNKIDVSEIDSKQAGLKRGYRKSLIYYPITNGQRAVKYKSAHRVSKFKPDEQDLDKHILLGQIYGKFNIYESHDKLEPDILYSSSESHIRYNIYNTYPIICTIPASKLMVVSALNKKDMSRPTKKSNLISMIEGREVTSKELPVMFVVVAPAYLKKLTLLDAHYLPWEISSSILYNLYQDLDYYKRTFQQVFLNAGYLPVSTDGLYWQVTKDDKTYKISELITGSTELMRTLMRPEPNTYIYIYSRFHLYGVDLDLGYSFLVFSWKDSKTYEVTKRDNHYHFEEISKEVLC